MNNNLEAMLQQELEGEHEEDKVTMCFTKSELETITRDYIIKRTPVTTLNRIMCKVFNTMGIRCLAEIDASTFDGEQRCREVIDEIQMVAARCIVKDVLKKRTVKHRKGDFKRDAKGNPITKADGTGYETYTTNESEVVEELEYAPYWDYLKSQVDEARLSRLIEDYIAPFDKRRIVEKLSANVDAEYAKQRIRELLKYYKFEDEEFFVESFALFMSNLKARTCGNEPPYPMMFSIYSKQNMGKTWLVDTLRTVVDELFETHCMTSSFDKAFGKFNSALMTRGLVTFSEVKGLTKADRDSFKRATTDNTIEIEMKGRDPFTQKNMATFLCVANEPILQQLVGLEMNRRILEFNLIDRARDEEGKILKLEHAELKSILTDILMSIPFSYDETMVLEHLDTESTGLLNYNMGEVIGDIFRSDRELNEQMEMTSMGANVLRMPGDTELISKTGQLRMVAFKRKCGERKVPVNQVFAWMSENGLAKKNEKNYSWFIDRKKLPELMGYETTEEVSLADGVR